MLGHCLGKNLTTLTLEMVPTGVRTRTLNFPEHIEHVYIQDTVNQEIFIQDFFVFVIFMVYNFSFL